MMLLTVALALTTVTSSFDVDGVKVILRQSDANNVVAANLYLLGGSRQVRSSNAGIEALSARSIRAGDEEVSEDRTPPEDVAAGQRDSERTL